MLTSQTKIRLALICVAAIASIMSVYTILKLNQIVLQIETIAFTDAKTAELGESLSIQMLEARREEKNFIIYLDSTFISRTRSILGAMLEDVRSAKESNQPYAQELDSIQYYLGLYSSNLDLLVKTFQEDPKALNRLHQQIISYQQELQQLAKRRQLSAADVPSLLPEVILSASTKMSADKARLFEDLKNNTSHVLHLSSQMAESARASLIANSEKGMQYGIKAKGNIQTALLLGGLILLGLIIWLPRQIFLPFNRMAKSLHAIIRGEDHVTLPNMNSRDELGELSRAFQKAVKRLQLFNELRAAKIASMRRNHNRILDEVDEAVIVLTPDERIRYANTTARILFDLSFETERPHLKDVPALENLLSDTLTDVEYKGKTIKEIKLRRKDQKMKILILLPIYSGEGDLEQSIVILK